MQVTTTHTTLTINASVTTTQMDPAPSHTFLSPPLSARFLFRVCVGESTGVNHARERAREPECEKAKERRRVRKSKDGVSRADWCESETMLGVRAKATNKEKDTLCIALLVYAFMYV